MIKKIGLARNLSKSSTVKRIPVLSKETADFCSWPLSNPSSMGRGYLLIYDLRRETNRSGQWEEIQKQNRRIFAAWI